MDEDVVLGTIYISPLVEARIYGKHGLEPEDVLDACHDRIGAAWVHDDQQGWRLFVEGLARTDMRVCVILYPTVDPTLWNLGTAFPG